VTALTVALGLAGLALCARWSTRPASGDPILVTGLACSLIAFTLAVWQAT